MIDIVYKHPIPEKIQRIRLVDPIKEISDELCNKFSRWLDNALPGDKYCYYLGYHVAGNRVARLAFDAYEDGKIILYQKKEDNKFSYWAQRKKRWE